MLVFRHLKYILLEFGQLFLLVFLAFTMKRIFKNLMIHSVEIGIHAEVGNGLDEVKVRVPIAPERSRNIKVMLLIVSVIPADLEVRLRVLLLIRHFARVVVQVAEVVRVGFLLEAKVRAAHLLRSIRVLLRVFPGRCDPAVLATFHQISVGRVGHAIRVQRLNRANLEYLHKDVHEQQDEETQSDPAESLARVRLALLMVQGQVDAAVWHHVRHSLEDATHDVLAAGLLLGLLFFVLSSGRSIDLVL